MWMAPSPTMLIKNIIYRECGKMTLVPCLLSNFHLISMIILSNVVISRLFSQKQVSNLFGLNMIHFIVLSHHRSLAGMARPKDCWAGRIA